MFRFLQSHLQARLRKIDPYFKCLKMRYGIPNAYILDKTMYKKHVSFCCYCTIEIPRFKTLTGARERGYTYILLLITIYIYIYKYIYISFETLKT